jgi:hypothetical protein
MKSPLKIFIIVSMALSCREESTDRVDNPLPADPAYTEVGITVGSIVTKNIGAEGGTLSSDDSRFEIEIPAGALSNSTPISIQAITNEAPGGVGLAYRFLPEGTKFNKPATLKFNYTQEELAGSAPQLMGIAFQVSDRSWRTAYEFEFDEISQTVFATTSHFTDFAAYERYKLIISEGYQDTIDISEFTALRLMTTYQPHEEDDRVDLPPLPSGSLDGEDDLPPLPQWHTSELRSVEWLVNGKTSNPEDGTLRNGAEIGSIPAIAGYTAPGKEPESNPVLITATISGVANPRDRLILGANVFIKSEYNFTLYLEYIEDAMCGYVDGHKSSADMDIHVKDDIVTVTNIVNHPVFLPNPTADAVGCTMTYERGTVDYGLILSAQGVVTKDPQGHQHKLFDITLKHTSGNSTCFLKCPDFENRTPLGEGEFEDTWSFILRDSVQVWRSPPGHLYSRLTPK